MNHRLAGPCALFAVIAACAASDSPATPPSSERQACGIAPEPPSMVSTQVDSRCGSCPAGEACFPGTTACAKTCSTDQECDPGHPCSGNLCDPQCDSRLCPEGKECVANACDWPECGLNAACPPGNFCDPSVHRCFPNSGRCDRATDCPLFHRQDAQVECTEGRCRWTEAKAFLPDNAPAQSMKVQHPEPLSPDDPLVEWVDGRAAEVLVLSSPVQSWLDLKARALWSAFFPRLGHPTRRSARWVQGTRIVDGRWTDAICPPPLERKLYVVVVAYDDGQPVDTTGLVPFRIGKRWQRAGDPCSEASDRCDNPWQSLLCIGSACQVPCGSDYDCDASLFPRRCGPPRGHAPRLCQR
jgi:hypothetical protein